MVRTSGYTPKAMVISLRAVGYLTRLTHHLQNGPCPFKSWHNPRNNMICLRSVGYTQANIVADRPQSPELLSPCEGLAVAEDPVAVALPEPVPAACGPNHRNKNTRKTGPQRGKVGRGCPIAQKTLLVCSSHFIFFECGRMCFTDLTGTSHPIHPRL